MKEYFQKMDIWVFWLSLSGSGVTYLGFQANQVFIDICKHDGRSSVNGFIGGISRLFTGLSALLPFHTFSSIKGDAFSTCALAAFFTSFLIFSLATAENLYLAIFLYILVLCLLEYMYCAGCTFNKKPSEEVAVFFASVSLFESVISLLFSLILLLLKMKEKGLIILSFVFLVFGLISIKISLQRRKGKV